MWSLSIYNGPSQVYWINTELWNHKCVEVKVKEGYMHGAFFMPVNSGILFSAQAVALHISHTFVNNYGPDTL